MSGRELLYRAIELQKKAVSFAQLGFARPEQLPTGSANLHALLTDPDAKLCFSRVVADKLRHNADAFASGQINLFGCSWPQISGRIDWHLDPVMRASWPRQKFCFSIPYKSNPEPTRGDIKYVWEVNRLQFVQVMAVVAYASNNAKLAERCGDIIEDWILRNPPFLGVNWNSGIELGLRAISILLVAELLGVSAFPRQRWERVVRSLASHAFWLARFPSKYSSANNHRIAEATSLYVISTMLPSIPHASSYANLARVVLEIEAQRQIHPDGVGAEQAPRYSAFVLELLMLAYAIAKRADAPFSDALRNRIELGAAFLADLLDARGDWPHIGDDDSSRVFYDGDDLQGTSRP